MLRDNNPCRYFNKHFPIIEKFMYLRAGMMIDHNADGVIDIRALTLEASTNAIRKRGCIANRAPATTRRRYYNTCKCYSFSVSCY